MWSFKYPYTNFHELNLDWILSEIEKLKKAQKQNSVLPYNVSFTSDFEDGDGVKGFNSIIDKYGNSENIVFVDGNAAFLTPYTIPENIIIVPAGGVINAVNQVTINGFIYPSRITVFSGDLAVNSKLNPVGYPEMFKDGSIQACINVFNKTELGAGDYTISSPIRITESGKTLSGCGSWASGGKYSRIIMLDSGRSAIEINSPLGDDGQIESVKIENLSIEYPQDAAQYVRGLSLQNTAHCRINNVSIYNACEGFFISRTVNTQLQGCMVINYVRDANFHAIGFHLGDGGAPYNNFVGQNASLFIENCTYIGNDVDAVAVGILCHNAVSDVSIDEFEFSAGECGIRITGKPNSNRENNNIRITNCLIERYWNSGIELSNLNPGCAVIENNYISPYAAPKNYTSAILLNGCHGGFSIQNNQIVFSYSQNWNDFLRGIISLNSSGIVVSNIYKDAHTCEYYENSKNIESFSTAYNTAHPSAGIAFSMMTTSNAIFHPRIEATPKYTAGVEVTNGEHVYINATSITGGADSLVKVNGAPVEIGQTSGTVLVTGV